MKSSLEEIVNAADALKNQAKTVREQTRSILKPDLGYFSAQKSDKLQLNYQINTLMVSSIRDAENSIQKLNNDQIQESTSSILNDIKNAYLTLSQCLITIKGVFANVQTELNKLDPNHTQA